MSQKFQSQRDDSHLDLWLQQLGEKLVDPKSRKHFLAAIRNLARAIIVFPAVGYSSILFFGIFVLRLVGENNLTIAFLLYLPRVLFLLPSFALLIPALFVDRRAAMLLSASSVAFLLFGMGWQIRRTPAPLPSERGRSLTVLTYNRGQHANQSLQPFKNRTDPDIIVLQEADRRANGYLKSKGYEKFVYAVDEAEFTLLSRYPVIGAETITPKSHLSGLPPAARFEIDFDGIQIAVYSIHPESPRDTLLYYRGGAFLWGILGIPGTPFAEKRKSNQQYWDQRIAETNELRDIFAKDPLPTLVVGDLNAPAGGYIHGLFLDAFQDAHQHSGAGFGYTFPGTTRNPLSLGGPWMRIDYLFCDDKWEPTWCITEKDRPSQHRAVTAQFRLLKSSR